MDAIEKKHNEVLPSLSFTRHATITKDTSIGFLRFVTNKFPIKWDKDGETLYSSDTTFFFTTSELYDIYVKSLEG